MSKAYTPNFDSPDRGCTTGGEVYLTGGRDPFTPSRYIKLESIKGPDSKPIPTNCISCGSNCITNRQCEHCGSKY